MCALRWGENPEVIHCLVLMLLKEYVSANHLEKGDSTTSINYTYWTFDDLWYGQFTGEKNYMSCVVWSSVGLEASKVTTESSEKCEKSREKVLLASKMSNGVGGQVFWSRRSLATGCSLQLLTCDNMVFALTLVSLVENSTRAVGGRWRTYCAYRWTSNSVIGWVHVWITSLIVSFRKYTHSVTIS